ncbi:hypothetical protein QFC21_003810 [Naganishia friedmannii]|uniref:Uncharacterized protein n=1 Tax=Naganishia friedmannii TaxID=89922 RepID=A0ACC2VM08_9TREE|nr:hypothetical protein QFC21_003810 [Naganishia friedmannii]
MPPKKGAKPDHKQASAATQDLEGAEQDPLQAVILADSFNRRFDVLCVDKPRCLLPMLGAPLLAWTLESLSLSNITEVIIFCTAHADAIREYVASSPYSKSLNVQCVSDSLSRSAGDALRKLDSMQIINPKIPFLLLHSPIVGNVDLSQLIKQHQALRSVDPNVIMSVGVGIGGRRHPESPIMVVNTKSSHLLQYTAHPILPHESRFHLPASLILDSATPHSLALEIWSGPSTRSYAFPPAPTHDSPYQPTASSLASAGGYRDLGIDVCEADIPAQLTENFDWNDLRRHLVRGVLQADLLGKKIAVIKVGESDSASSQTGTDDQKKTGIGMGKGRYVERIRDTRTYADITRDILRRWAFPLVPDSGILTKVDYDLRIGGVYVAKDGVTLARTAQVYGPCLIGPKTSLASNTYIKNSTIGSNCHIGSHTQVCQSFIFENVRIGKGCTLNTCIIGKGVVIEEGVTIGRGALLGDGVRIGKGQVVQPFARVGRTPSVKNEDDSDEEDTPESQEADAQKLEGPTSIGYIWPADDMDETLSDDEDERELLDPYEHPDNKRLLQLGRDLDDDVSDTESTCSTLSRASSSHASTVSLASSTGIPVGVASAADFSVEARLTLERNVSENHSVSDTILELKTLMLSSNVGISGPGGGREAVVASLMSLIDVAKGAKEVKAKSEQVWTKWGGVLAGLNAPPVDSILEVQRFCVQNPAYAPFFHFFLNALYTADVVESSHVIGWYRSEAARGRGEPEGAEDDWKALWERGRMFVTAMMEAEDSDEEEESDDDGE